MVLLQNLLVLYFHHAELQILLNFDGLVNHGIVSWFINHTMSMQNVILMVWYSCTHKFIVYI